MQVDAVKDRLETKEELQRVIDQLLPSLHLDNVPELATRGTCVPPFN